MPDEREDIRRKSFMTTVELGCVCLNISSVAAQNWDVTWVYRLQVYLNEDEDDVTRKKFRGYGGCNFADRKEPWVVIPVASQRFPAWVPASKLLTCVPLANP